MSARSAPFHGERGCARGRRRALRRPRRGCRRRSQELPASTAAAREPAERQDEQDELCADEGRPDDAGSREPAEAEDDEADEDEEDEQVLEGAFRVLGG